VISSTIRRLTFPDSCGRPSASDLLNSTFLPHEVTSKSGTLARLEDENESLRGKVKVQETQLSLQLEVIRKQKSRIEMLEKMIASKLFHNK
jgi:hypothetical protein